MVATISDRAAKATQRMGSSKGHIETGEGHGEVDPRESGVLGAWFAYWAALVTRRKKNRFPRILLDGTRFTGTASKRASKWCSFDEAVVAPHPETVPPARRAENLTAKDTGSMLMEPTERYRGRKNHNRTHFGYSPCV
jgi:hypothetical protein